MRDMKKPELIIFDMDGLLFDTERMAFTSCRRAARNYGYEVDEELFKKTIGINLKSTFELYREHFGEAFPSEDIKNDILKIYDDLIKQNGVPVKEGLYELLDYLKKVDIKLAVATSTGRQRAADLLKLAGIDRCFDYILCGDEIVNSKPDPEIFLKVSEKLGCTPENCIVLEDSEAGIAAAYNAGMLPIMIPDMKEPEDAVKSLVYKQLGSLLEAKAFLEGILG